MTRRARRPLIAGNWKMNGLHSSLAELDLILAGAQALASGIDFMICPPATIVAACVSRARGTDVVIGGQDCHPDPSGPFTGDISAEMLKDAGAGAVIIGHSERRQFHGETDADVHAKARAAHRAGLQAVVCLGETKDQRSSGKTLEIVARQLEALPDDSAGNNLVIAYEPVWAIGTGLTPSPLVVVAVHDFIRDRILARLGPTAEGIRILYGGSVKPSNGASLKAQELLAIARAI